MKHGILFCTLWFTPAVFGQIVYDPTVIHSAPGEFYHHEHIYTLELEFYDPNYHSILKTWKENYIEDALPAKLDYGAYHYDSVAVKYKGNSTFAVPNLFNNQKMPYNIDINDLVSGQNIEGYKKLKLGNAWFDPTFSKELISSYIHKQYMPCYENNLMRLVVNGSYLGVYVNQEDVGPVFLKRHFGENNGAFFKCEPMPEEQAGHPVQLPSLLWWGNDTLNYYESYERKSTGGWPELLNLIDVLNNNPSQLDQVINIDRVLWFFAVSQVLSNEDTYNTTIIHNYYLYQTADGKFQILPWDLTESFCGILFTGGTPESHYELDPLYGLSPYFADRPLVYNLLNQPYYRKRYFAHIRTIMDEYYNITWLKNWVQELQTMAYDAVNTDPNKPHNMTKFINNVDVPVNYLITYTIAGMTDVVTNRKPYLEAYPDIAASEPIISTVTQNIQHPSSSETVYVSAAVSNATSVALKVTNNDAPYASDFTAIAMLDDGLNGDANAGDGIYTAAIPFNTPNDHIKYYIEAENANALSLMPERAEYFYYHYYVDQVVALAENNSPTFSVYPNPTSEYVTIDPDFGDTYTLTLYNQAGQLMATEKEVQGSMTLDVSSYPKGLYHITIESSSVRLTNNLVIN